MEEYTDHEEIYPVEEAQVTDDTGEETVPFNPYSITSYGADYTVEIIVSKLNSGTIFIPEFQRKFIWPKSRSSRFVESLLYGLPVPGIFLSKDEETQKLMIIDGQQRLLSLQYFYEGIFRSQGKESIFRLTGVDDPYNGKDYKSLSEEDRLRLNDSILHATILKQEQPEDDNSSIFHVFERINTGGMILRPQEIRACIFHGNFNRVINELNDNENWRNIFGPSDKRLKDRELILRFFALYFSLDSYKEPMVKFLNGYMSENRNLEKIPEHELKALFSKTISTIYICLDKEAFKPERLLNAAVFDAVMVGIARRLEKGDISDLRGLESKYRELIENPSFEKAYRTATANAENVRSRILLAVEAFKEIG